MPEVHARLRWPDGSGQRITSPSRTLERAIRPGAAYEVGDLVTRVVLALEAGSDRVFARYGFHCSAAAATIEAVRERAAGQEGVVQVQEVWRAGGPRASAA